MPYSVVTAQQACSTEMVKTNMKHRCLEFRKANTRTLTLINQQNRSVQYIIRFFQSMLHLHKGKISNISDREISELNIDMSDNANVFDVMRVDQLLG